MKVAIIKLDDGREIKGIIIDYQEDYFEVFSEDIGSFWIHRKLIQEIKEVR